jgi:hypothetical protein
MLGAVPPEPGPSPWLRFSKIALVWFVPALLVLPLYLVAVAISVAAADGALLEASDGLRGRLFAALGPLLVACGLALAVVTVRWGEDVEAYLGGGAAATVCVFLGAVMIRRELARLRRSDA